MRRKGLRLMLMALQDRGYQPTIDDLIRALESVETRAFSDLRDVEAQIMSYIAKRRQGSDKTVA